MYHEGFWWADGLSVLSGKHEADIGEVARFYDPKAAKLGAAAPELLAACERLIRLLEHERLGFKDNPGLDRERAILKKARDQ